MSKYKNALVDSNTSFNTIVSASENVHISPISGRTMKRYTIKSENGIIPVYADVADRIVYPVTK